MHLALWGERTLHLRRGGVVVETHQAVENAVAWRDVDEVREEKWTDADGRVHICVLVANGGQVRLRACQRTARP